MIVIVKIELIFEGPPHTVGSFLIPKLVNGI